MAGDTETTVTDVSSRRAPRGAGTVLNRRRVVGLAGLAGVAGTALALQATRGAGPVATVTGIIGSEKGPLFEDEQIRTRLQDSHRLRVNYRQTGSLKLVEGDLSGQDFVWPGSQYHLEVYERLHGPAQRAEELFYSPIVLYAWSQVAAALSSAGIAQREGDVQYVDASTLVSLLTKGETWAGIGFAPLREKGRILASSTDPTKSNSGLLFAGLLANTLAGGIAGESSLPVVLPALKTYFELQGLMPESSRYIFEQFLALGMGTFPLIVGYESQLIEYVLGPMGQTGQARPAGAPAARPDVTVLYLRPTVWSSHVLIARSATGVRLLEALKEPAVRAAAWQRHGFRTQVAGSQSTPGEQGAPAMPLPSVAPAPPPALPLPRASVLDRIVEAL